MKKLILFLGVPILAIFILILFRGHDSIDQDNLNNMNGASPIINALDQYGKANQNYPKTIQELSPLFLDSLPKTTQNQDFLYRRDTDDGYYLCFMLNDETSPYRPGCCYTPENDWECSPGE